MDITLILETHVTESVPAKYHPPCFLSVGTKVDFGLTVEDFFEELIRPLMSAYGYQMQDWALTREE